MKGPLFLAPLAGISNRPFRLLARRFGADLCYTEMISADAIVREQSKTLKMIDISSDEHPIGIQLFGSEPENMAGAVKSILRFNPDLIDINLGCPVKKVIRKNGGAALLKDLILAGEIMAAAVENSPIPVTIKIRSGWETGSDAYLELGKKAENAGIAAITLHPRSRTQGYSEKADWSKIALLKRAVNIPVIGNGDIQSGPDAEKMFAQTGCDAVMVARAAMKNPYVFRQISHYLKTGEVLEEMSADDKIGLALEHSAMMIEHVGEEVGIKKMRKHLVWYTKGFRRGTELRKCLQLVKTMDDIEELLNTCR